MNDEQMITEGAAWPPQRVEHVPLYGDGVDKASLRYRCPGCGHLHVVNLGDSGWSWNQDYVKPTLYPSVVLNYRDGQRCHAWIRDGKAIFLSDSTHDHAGETLPLPPLNAIDNTDAIYKLIGNPEDADAG